MSNDPQKMLNRLRGKAAKPKTQHNIPEIKTKEELAQQSQENGRWNESLLGVTKKLVREGRSDAEIHAVTDQLTTGDYTVQDLRSQVQPMIDGARSKPLANFIPMSPTLFWCLPKQSVGRQFLPTMNLTIEIWSSPNRLADWRSKVF